MPKVHSFFTHLFSNAEEAADTDLELLDAVRQVLADRPGVDQIR